MNKYTCLSAFLAIIMIAGGCSRQPAVTSKVEITPYLCREAISPIVVDGVVDEAAWQLADTITTFYPFQPKNAKTLSPTKARVMWDHENLYMAIVCTDADIWSYSDQADDTLWQGDAVELFIKPTIDSPTYYEFVIAPNGTLYDSRYPSRGAGGYYRFKQWSSMAQIATQINGTDDDPSDMDANYTVEMAIPLSAFRGVPLPSSGNSWSFGVFRCDYSKTFDQALLMMSIPESANNGFHYYEGYQPLVFK